MFHRRGGDMFPGGGTTVFHCSSFWVRDHQWEGLQDSDGGQVSDSEGEPDRKKM